MRRAPDRRPSAPATVVEQLAAELARGLADPTPRDARALAAMALCVGGLGLSRAVGDPALADAISGACARAAERELSRPPRPEPGAQATRRARSGISGSAASASFASSSTAPAMRSVRRWASGRCSRQASTPMSREPA